MTHSTKRGEATHASTATTTITTHPTGSQPPPRKREPNVGQNKARESESPNVGQNKASGQEQEEPAQQDEDPGTLPYGGARTIVKPTTASLHCLKGHGHGLEARFDAKEDGTASRGTASVVNPALLGVSREKVSFRGGENGTITTACIVTPDNTYSLASVSLP